MIYKQTNWITALLWKTFKTKRNLMKENKTANYLVTAHWGEKAIEECKKYGNPVEVVPMK